MPIDNRELAAGTKLVASYKKAQFSCEVIDTDAGRAFKLADGRTFKSPSSAGKAITGRVSCDGWTFWSVESATAAAASTSETAPIATRSEKPAKPRSVKRLRQIKKLRSQKDAPEGHTGWFCSACQKGFNLPNGQEPASCPEGHPWEVDDEFETAS